MIPFPPEPWQEDHQESGLHGACVERYVGNEFVKKNICTLYEDYLLIAMPLMFDVLPLPKHQWHGD